MSWRDHGDDDGSHGELLRVVLEHYDVRLRDRDVQNVSCPLHEDRTPSCSVDLARGVWKCHSCGETGGVYKLVMLKEGVQLGRARAIATDIARAAGCAEGGGGTVRGFAYGGRGEVPRRSRDRRAGGGYVPFWRRG